MTRSLTPRETVEGSGYPTVRQLSVFLENRVGQLLKLTKVFEEAAIRIVAVSVVNSVDCAIIRLLVDDPDRATQLLKEQGFVLSSAALLAVVLPPGKRALLSLYAALTSAEVGIQYMYPLLIHPDGRSAVAINVDDPEMAIRTLNRHSFDVLTQDDLGRSAD